MHWVQKRITLSRRGRGFFLVTNELITKLPELNDFTVGMVHFFMQHTSASLTLNENADPTVRDDFESFFNDTVPETAPYWIHTYEGPDDMPAHIKASVLGNGLTVPIADGKLLLGTWQGIYYGEHRNHAGGRNVIVTLFGDRRDALPSRR